MNACKILLSIFLIISKDIQNYLCTTTSEMRFDLFHKNTNTIHSTVNKIFTSLKLKETFKKSMKIRLLLAMHKNLINILNNNYKNNEVESNSDKTPIKEFLKHDIMDEILEEEFLLLFFSPNDTVQHDFQNNNTLNDSISVQLSGHLQQFLLKLDKITSQKANDGTSDIKNPKTYNRTLTRRSGRRIVHRNLKAWVPDPEQSFAFNRRIYRGINTKIIKYPFMASVHISGDFVCAGSIISKDLVITAASCLQIAFFHRHNKEYQGNVSVRIGSDFTSHDGQSISISHIYFHPKYNPQTLKHNLAIMRMSKQKLFPKNSKIRRVILDKTLNDLLSDTKRVTIVGWGAKDELNNNEESTKLSLAHIDLYDVEECKSVYSDAYVTESNFCAGFVSKGSGACSKDVGDPAVVSGVLVGIVSFGPPLCGTPDAPTVFTRLGIYAGWIDGILNTDPEMTTTKSILRIPLDATSRKPDRNTEVKRKGVKGLGHIRLDFPEEFFILKEILTDIATSNDSAVINDIIDEGFDKELLDFVEPPSRMDLQHHPLVNRSMFGIPGANYPKEKQQTRKHKELATTTNLYSFTIPGHEMFTDYMDYNKLGQMFDVFYHQEVSHLLPKTKHPPPVITETSKHAKVWFGRTLSTLKPKVIRPVMTTPIFDAHGDSVDESLGNYEGNSSTEGLSIEVTSTTTKPINATAKIIFDSDDNDYKDYNKAKTAIKFEESDSEDRKAKKVFDWTDKIYFNSKEITKSNDQNYNENKNIFGKKKIIVVYGDENKKDNDYTYDFQKYIQNQYGRK